MRLLYVITGLGVGGAERLISGLADRMSELGHDVLICYLTGEARFVPRNPNIPVIGLGLNGITSFPIAFFRLKLLIKNFKPDIIHANLFHANILSRLASPPWRSYKLICSSHSSNEGGRLRMMLYRATNFLSDLNTNVSHGAVASLVKRGGFAEGNMVAVHNGIDTHSFIRDPAARDSVRDEFLVSASTLVFLSVGRLVPQKGYDYLLGALKQIKEKNHVKFISLIAGEGECREELEKTIESLSLGDCVTLLGIRDDIPRLMSGADLFVLSSVWEGFGLVVAEAISCETSVVSTDCGGTREVIGDHGVLVRPKDSEALASGILAYLQMPEDKKLELRGKAKERVQKLYSQDAMVSTWLKIYHNE